jgi:formate dehydrogenase (NADP+) beta subunit
VTAPCMNACPSNVNVPAYLEEIRFGRWTDALAVVREDCPMPGTIGRVCVRPCESNCRRGLIDQPLAIKLLKRFLADREIAVHANPGVVSGKDKLQKVAVIGAGPAGLSCAFYLGIMGYHCTIFESQEAPGGMASYGIPAYRLPRDVLAYEASLVEQLGAEFRYGVTIGSDLSVEDLGRQGYQAVFLAVGAPESSKMRCEGEDAGYQCFMTGIQFLAEVSRGKKPLEGKKILVIGGGNVAMDCVRSAVRIGFDDANILYRRTEAEMPADPVEIKEAREEGVSFHFLVAPVRIMAENGKVIGLECLRMELGEPDESGRCRPIPMEGSNFVIDCDAVIPAVGQVCVVDCVLPRQDSITRWKTLVVDEITFQTRDASIFGGGDCVTGPYTLISALAAGKKAARFIDRYLQEGSNVPSVPDVLEKLIKDIKVFDPSEKFGYRGTTHQAHPEVLSPSVRRHCFDEVEKGLTSAQAVREANRCLRCYRICVAAI